MTIYPIMKTMWPPGYYHNGFVATHPFGHDAQLYNCTSSAQVRELPQSHCDDKYLCAFKDVCLFFFFFYNNMILQKLKVETKNT